MAGGKETPRQKMIGMMYLVLLALLAMNVSKEILLSFVIIDEALGKTNTAFNVKNEQAINEFEKQYQLNKEKVGEWYQKAKSVHEASKEMTDYIDLLKRTMIIQTEGFPDADQYVSVKSDGQVTTYSPAVDSLFNLKFVESKDNYDKITHAMIGDASNPKEGEFTAKELRLKLEEFQEKLFKLIPDKHKSDFETKNRFDFADLQVSKGGTSEKWEVANFYHVPVAAVVTNLSRLSAEVRAIQSEAMNLLFSEISASDFKFDTLAVKVLPNANIVTLGDSFKADLIVAAYSTTENPILEVGGDIDTSAASPNDWKVINPLDTARVKIDKGVASYGFKTSTEGEVNWGGFIKMKKPGTDNEFAVYPFKHTFIVQKPSTVVSPTKMNVVYRGLENPIEVSVGGYAPSQLQVSADNGTLSGSNGKYTIKPGQGKECAVRVSVKSKDGKVSPMGEPFKFRVKDIPKPEPFFAGVTGSGKATSGRLKLEKKVTAKLEDFDFEGVNYTVVAFDLVVNVRGRYSTYSSKSENLTSEMAGVLANQQRGDKVTIQNIFAVGPDGKRKGIGNIILDVQ